MTLLSFFEIITQRLNEFSGHKWKIHKGGSSYSPHIYFQKAGLGACILIAYTGVSYATGNWKSYISALSVPRRNPEWKGDLSFRSVTYDMFVLLPLILEKEFSEKYDFDRMTEERENQFIDELVLYMLRTTNIFSPLDVLVRGLEEGSHDSS